MKYLITAILVISSCGCVDSATKRNATIFNIKTQTAAKEYEEAKTPEDKDAIASEYFHTAPKFTQLFDDYVHGRQPAPDPVPPAPLQTFKTGPNRWKPRKLEPAHSVP